MKLIAISVCVNYSDFAAWTIPINKSLFDKWYVVTDEGDIATKQLCNYWGIDCVQTSAFYENDSTFNKYAGINEALKKIRADADVYIVFLDIDIMLSPNTRRVLENIDLKNNVLYGIDRVNCKGVSQFVTFMNYPDMIIDNWLLTPADMELGSRIIHMYGQPGDNGKFGGWKPLGFFQLAHRESFDVYPQECNGADHCDIEFANMYDRSNRIMIPEILGVHLESENAQWGSNWKGRKTALFNLKYSTESNG